MGRLWGALCAGMMVWLAASSAWAGCARYNVEQQEVLSAPPNDCLSFNVRATDTFCDEPKLVITALCNGDARLQIVEGSDVFIPEAKSMTVSEGARYTIEIASGTQTVRILAVQGGVEHDVTLMFTVNSDYGSCAVANLSGHPVREGGFALLLGLASIWAVRRRR